MHNNVNTAFQQTITLMERERSAKGCFCSAKMVKKLKRHTECMQLCNPMIQMDELQGGSETESTSKPRVTAAKRIIHVLDSVY